MLTLPSLVILYECIQQAYQESLILVHQVPTIESPHPPVAVPMEVWLQPSFMAHIPEASIFINVPIIAQPRPFVYVMTESTTDRIVFPAVTDVVEELREDKAVRRFLQMFAKRPPSEVINLFETLVGTLKERNILFHPVP